MYNKINKAKYALENIDEIDKPLVNWEKTVWTLEMEKWTFLYLIVANLISFQRLKREHPVHFETV